MAVNRRHIAQILEMESISTNQEDNEFTVLAKIVQLDHGSGWCYASCSKCNKNLDIIDGSFVCSICNQECRYLIIRYKIHVHVIDESGHTTFVIFNQEAEKLLDSCANKFVNRLGIGSNQLPEEIINLTGKIFIFKIKVPPTMLIMVIKLYDVYDMVEPQFWCWQPVKEEDAFGKQVLQSSEIVDSICRVDTSVYPAKYISSSKKKKRNAASLITDEDDAFGKQVAVTSVYSAIVGKEPIQLKMKKLKSGKIINLRLLARRKHEANFNKPVLDGISWLVKERPERGAGITNCAGEELIGTAGASGDDAVVGWVAGVGGIDGLSCLSWLDNQKPKSVIYVCFGSLAKFPEAQITEIAFALEQSKQPEEMKESVGCRKVLRKGSERTHGVDLDGVGSTSGDFTTPDGRRVLEPLQLKFAA
ncbi:hypothetical protein LXL04_001222 [Taraxacum kok-saghyz]